MRTHSMAHRFGVGLLWCALAACSRQADSGAPAMATDAAAPEASSSVVGQANRAGSFLAYEHEVMIRTRAQDIARRVEFVRKACMAGQFGTCSVLNEEQSAGESPSGSLKMRAEAKAIEPLVKLAADGADIAQRSTHAEDLADAVRDNGLREQRLRVQHEKLIELMARRDIKVEDLIALTQQLSSLEADMQSAEQESAQQQRRIETNLLTISFQSEGVTVESSRIRQAIRGLGETWDASVATLITVVGALLPFAAFVLVIVVLVRFIRRRKKA